MEPKTRDCKANKTKENKIRKQTKMDICGKEMKFHDSRGECKTVVGAIEQRSR